jgi:hypothetical protein
LFDPLSEFENQEEMTKEMSFEKAMRAMFDAMEGLEEFSKYSRYPNITVHPIAVFREINQPILSENITADLSSSNQKESPNSRK